MTRAPSATRSTTYVEALVAAPPRAGVDAHRHLASAFPGSSSRRTRFALEAQARAARRAPHRAAGRAHADVHPPARARARARRSARSTRAVVFEGEHTLLELVPRARRAARAARAAERRAPRSAPGRQVRAGRRIEDLRALPAPDFDGLPLDRYFSPAADAPVRPDARLLLGQVHVLPLRPRRGRHRAATASAAPSAIVDHLARAGREARRRASSTSRRTRSRRRRCSSIAQAIIARGLDLRWGTDMQAREVPDRRRARDAREGGAVACALGVESANAARARAHRQGRPGRRRRETHRAPLRRGGRGRGDVLHRFPDRDDREAMETLAIPRRSARRASRSTSSASSASRTARSSRRSPASSASSETWRLEGDELGTGLFYAERRAQQARPTIAKSSRARSASCRRAGAAALSVGGRALDRAHDAPLRALGPGVFRERAQLPPVAPFGRAPARRRRASTSTRWRGQRRGRARDLARARARAPSRVAGGLWRRWPRRCRRCRRGRGAIASWPARRRCRRARRRRGRRPPNASNSAG